MSYRLNRPDRKDKFGIQLEIYSNISQGCGAVIVSTEEGHNQEFYDKESTFTYIILEGQGAYFLDDEKVLVTKGDMLSVAPGTRIYYQGKMKMVLITTPAWRAENEVETRSSLW